MDKQLFIRSFKRIAIYPTGIGTLWLSEELGGHPVDLAIGEADRLMERAKKVGVDFEAEPTNNASLQSFIVLAD